MAWIIGASNFNAEQAERKILIYRMMVLPKIEKKMKNRVEIRRERCVI